MTKNQTYRSHKCDEIRESDIDKEVKVAGWIQNIRDHGGVKFLDLRDYYGVLQIVVHDEKMIKHVNKETVISIDGSVKMRDKDTINPKIKTGTVEVEAKNIEILGPCKNELPFEIMKSKKVKEDIRLKNRFLDLRNQEVQRNMIMRSKVISFMRKKMESMGFLDIQTPILSSSSPEGARDYLIPSRKFHGKFYALPQAPQIFKQLLMVSGFDKYYQIAPCFRDEDSRADRSPGEFYQLDFEMAFANQEDVLRVTEEVLYDTFKEFSNFEITKPPFERITYKDTMLKYGTDKPDLRNPLVITELSDLFIESSFKPFSNKCVRGINVPDCASSSKGFFEKMLKFATEIGMKGLGYFKVDDDLKFQGPIDKFLDDSQRKELIKRCDLKPGCVLYFIADTPKDTPIMAGQIRNEVARRKNLCEKDAFKFCFIVDFPMFDRDPDTGKIIFTHNPFSMPQGGMDDLLSKDPLKILAWQYDVVCNGVELSSGAVRNHRLDTLFKAFEIAGYKKEDVEESFSSLTSAFEYGAPPHAGMAPGIDRMVMLLTNQENIREVIPFPMNSNAQDLLLGAPSEISEVQLREAHIKIR